LTAVAAFETAFAGGLAKATPTMARTIATEAARAARGSPRRLGAGVRQVRDALQ
jgi:hypothetical protein